MSIDTKNSDRDLTLRSGDFFDASRYPKLTFRSVRVVPAGTRRITVPSIRIVAGGVEVER